ncbi:hypothetical protein D3C76_1796350 [compost metagenome]
MISVLPGGGIEFSLYIFTMSAGGHFFCSHVSMEGIHLPNHTAPRLRIACEDSCGHVQFIGGGGDPGAQLGA